MNLKLEELIKKKYKIIYADPPWSYHDKALDGNRGACCKYPVLSTYDITRLAVEDISDDDCFLFLWSTWPMLQDVLDVIKAWGFTYKTAAFVWVKKNGNGTWCRNMGHWTRSNSEPCLLAVKGKPKRIDGRISQVIASVPKEHSKKPDVVRDRITQLCGDLPRVELFTRNKAHGWDVFGNDERLKHQTLEIFS